MRLNVKLYFLLPANPCTVNKPRASVVALATVVWLLSVTMMDTPINGCVDSLSTVPRTCADSWADSGIGHRSTRRLKRNNSLLFCLITYIYLVLILNLWGIKNLSDKFCRLHLFDMC